MPIRNAQLRKSPRPALASLLAVMALAAVILISLNDPTRRPGTVEGNDISVYLEGARGFAKTGNPYGTGFVSPAPFAFLLLPLSLLPADPAAWLWFWLSLLALTGLAAMSILLAGAPVSGWLVAIGTGALFVWPAVNYGVVLGQSSAIVALLLTMAIAIAGHQPSAAGALAAVALVIKPHLGILVVLGMAADELRRRRAYRFILTCLLTVTALLAATFSFSRRWWEVTLAQPPESWNYWGSTIGSNVFFTALLGDRSAGWFLHGVVVAWVVVGLGVWWWRSRPARPRLGAALLAATFLVTPYAYPHDYVLMALPLIWLTAAICRPSRITAVPLVAILWGVAWLAPQPARYDDWRFLALGAPAALLALVLYFPGNEYAPGHAQPAGSAGLDEPTAFSTRG
jgi:hypothetical protein